MGRDPWAIGSFFRPSTDFKVWCTDYIEEQWQTNFITLQNFPLGKFLGVWESLWLSVACDLPFFQKGFTKNFVGSRPFGRAFGLCAETNKFDHTIVGTGVPTVREQTRFVSLRLGEKLAVCKDFLVWTNGQSRTPVPTGLDLNLLFLPQSIGKLTFVEQNEGEA